MSFIHIVDKEEKKFDIINKKGKKLYEEKL